MWLCDPGRMHDVPGVWCPPSYYALRVCPRAASPEWWAAARNVVDAAPPAIQAILAGRRRVEVSAEEATSALSWAKALPGWDRDSFAPLWIYPSTPTDGD
jgi:hypothetical protein